MKNQVIIRNSDIILLPYSRVVGASGLLHLAIKYKVPIIISGSGALFEELEDIGTMVLWCYGAMVIWCQQKMLRFNQKNNRIN
jgi:hypothetical protein